MISAALQIFALVALRLFRLPFSVTLAQAMGARTPAVSDLRVLEWALAASAARIGGTCLTQALAARALGASTSSPARLVIGVRRTGGVPEFHAWAEIADAVFPATSDRASFAPVKVWS